MDRNELPTSNVSRKDSHSMKPLIFTALALVAPEICGYAGPQFGGSTLKLLALTTAK